MCVAWIGVLPKPLPCNWPFQNSRDRVWLVFALLSVCWLCSSWYLAIARCSRLKLVHMLRPLGHDQSPTYLYPLCGIITLVSAYQGH